jgi:hypothetical protein
MLRPIEAAAWVASAGSSVFAQFAGAAIIFA